MKNKKPNKVKEEPAVYDSYKVSEVIDKLVPISRFNKGEANKVFEEVRTDDYKVVMKNNSPAGILMDVEYFEELQEIIEDLELTLETVYRLSNNDGMKTYTEEEMLNYFGISKDELIQEESTNE